MDKKKYIQLDGKTYEINETNDDVKTSDIISVKQSFEVPQTNIIQEAPNIITSKQASQSLQKLAVSLKASSNTNVLQGAFSAQAVFNQEGIGNVGVSDLQCGLLVPRNMRCGMSLGVYNSPCESLPIEYECFKRCKSWDFTLSFDYVGDGTSIHVYFLYNDEAFPNNITSPIFVPNGQVFKTSDIFAIYSPLRYSIMSLTKIKDARCPYVGGGASLVSYTHIILSHPFSGRALYRIYFYNPSLSALPQVGSLPEGVYGVASVTVSY